MTRFHVFIIRAIVGLGFAVLLTRFFYGRVQLIYVLALAIFLVGMSYVTEYMRNRKQMKAQQPEPDPPRTR